MVERTGGLICALGLSICPFGAQRYAITEEAAGMPGGSGVTRYGAGMDWVMLMPRRVVACRNIFLRSRDDKCSAICHGHPPNGYALGKIGKDGDVCDIYFLPVPDIIRDSLAHPSAEMGLIAPPA